MQTEIKRWGNSAAVRIPSKLLAQAKLAVSSPISMAVTEGKIVIEMASSQKRKVNLPFSEAYLLAGLDANSAHAELLTAPVQEEMEA